MTLSDRLNLRAGVSRSRSIVALCTESRLPAFMPEKLAPLSELQPRGQTSLVNSPDDRELAERLARGDAWAREALYRKYVSAVWGLALRLTGDRTDAEDVVQDTFAEALRDAAQLRDHGAIRPWLLSVAVHQVHRRFRRRRLLRLLGLDRGVEPQSLDALAARETPPDVVLELRNIAGVLAGLPPKPRIAWTLRYVEGCTLSEVAEYCQCSLATAKRQIVVAQRKLAGHVEFAEPSDD
jgi:RNA polymerase sigma-70 factor (ECF subfamily)